MKMISPLSVWLCPQMDDTVYLFIMFRLPAPFMKLHNFNGGGLKPASGQTLPPILIYSQCLPCQYADSVSNSWIFNTTEKRDIALWHSLGMVPDFFSIHW